MPELLEKSVAFSTVDVTVTTTTETVVIASGAVKVPSQTCLVHVRAWAQMTVGTAATAITPRIRRGSTATGALVGEGTAVTVLGAAGSTEPIMIEVLDSRVNEDTVEYVFTVQQTAATGNGSVVQRAIEVEIISG